MPLLAIPLLATALALIFWLGQQPQFEEEERDRLSGDDDQDIDFDAALRSLDRDRPHREWGRRR